MVVVVVAAAAKTSNSMQGSHLNKIGKRFQLNRTVSFLLSSILTTLVPLPYSGQQVLWLCKFRWMMIPLSSSTVGKKNPNCIQASEILVEPTKESGKRNRRRKKDAAAAFCNQRQRPVQCSRKRNPAFGLGMRLKASETV